ncbi:MAG: hypothetical protein HKN76_06160 [Saprospiraceae bacterium]|nr:hypothetical protein [Saprospiraceae bacterium]
MRNVKIKEVARRESNESIASGAAKANQKIATKEYPYQSMKTEIEKIAQPIHFHSLKKFYQRSNS